MRTIKAIHIDDEKDSIDVLRLLLADCLPKVELVGWAQNVDDGIALVENEEPNVVFLDIEMPGKNGFDLLNQLDHRNFDLIIISGYENYAIQAIKYAALDYLLKPLDVDELKAALGRLTYNPEPITNRLTHLSALLAEEEGASDNVIISSSDGFKKVSLNDITYMKSQSGGYTLMHLDSGRRKLVTKPLKHFEELLPKDRFMRVHRSFLVNVEKVKAYDSVSGKITLSTSEVVVVAARKKTAFLRVMRHFSES